MITLQQEREIGRCIFREANDALFIVHPLDLRVIDANPAAQRLTVLRRKQLLQCTVHDLFESDRPGALDALVNACRTTIQFIAADDYFLKTASGEKLPVQLSVSRIHTEPEPFGLLAVRDVSRRRQTEEALRRSEERYRLLVEQANVILWEADLADCFTYVSGHAEIVLGYPISEWYKPGFWAEHIHADDRAWVINFCKENAVRGGTYSFEYRMIAADGRVVWLRDICTAVLKDGQPVALRGVFVDITVQKCEEQALAESQSRLRTITDHAPDFILQVDRAGRIAFINRVLPHLRVEQVLGTTLYEWVPEQYRERIKHALETVFAEARLQEYETPAEGAGGETAWYQARVAPVIVHDQVDSAIVFAHDVTDRLRAERERQAAEAQAKQHLAELAHALRLSTMGEMAAALAHEVHQPLSAISNFAGGCLRRLQSGDTPADELAYAIEQIAAQSIRAGEIVRRMKDFVRKRMPRRSTLNLNEVVQHVSPLIEAEARLRRIALRIELAQGLPLLQGDAIQIEQVILNLARNGLEAMEGSEPASRELTIRTRPGGQFVELAVQDRGRGFDPHDAERLFEPFYTTKSDGMGLGLSISRSIVEAHGGRLWATPNPEGGSTFHFTLACDLAGSDP